MSTSLGDVSTVSAPVPGGRGGDQRIPRPPDARPGAPAPWAQLGAERRRRIRLGTVVEVVRARNRASSPDAAAVLGTEPACRSGPLAVPELEQLGTPSVRWPGGGPDDLAAVLVALFEESDETRVVLTRRSAGLRAHGGEVSFPGGRAEPGETPEQAALREAAEEVGIEPAAVRTAGWLGALQTVSSGSRIVPVVGVLDTRPSFRVNVAEVARVFDVALAELLADGVFRQERWPGASDDGVEVWRPVTFFELAGETIWGATAAILFELLSAVVC